MQPRAQDLPALAEMAIQSYRDAFIDFLPPAVLERRDAEHFLRRFRRDHAGLRAVIEDGRPLGYSLLHNRHLELLFLAIDARGRGIGAALLADAVARGCRSLECFAANHPARRFYERQGWRAVSRYRRVLDGALMDFVRYELR